MSDSDYAFVSLSGGIDSSTALAFAVRDFGARHVIALSVNYGQRHDKEIQAAASVARYLNVFHSVLEITGMPKVMLTDKEAEVPNISYSEIKGVSPTYVPFRNGQLISKVAGYAANFVESYCDGRGHIYFGAHAEDAEGDAYPDCRLDFIGAMGAAVYIGTYHKVRLRAPLIEMYKDEIIAAGHKLGVPWHLTWSCYVGGEKHCGVCPTCRARKEGFKQANINDPTEYEV